MEIKMQNEVDLNMNNSKMVPLLDRKGILLYRGDKGWVIAHVWKKKQTENADRNFSFTFAIVETSSGRGIKWKIRTQKTKEFFEEFTRASNALPSKRCGEETEDGGDANVSKWDL